MMLPRRRAWVGLALGHLLACVCGCGTTRMTDTPRSGSEMLLISQSVDMAVAQIDASPLCDRKVFLDQTYLDAIVDRGYVVGTIRQHLLAAGAKLQETKDKAEIVVEIRAGALGTDRYSSMFGISQMTIPTAVVTAGLPTQIPEVALIRKTEVKGVAKISLHAYHRETGTFVWHSGQHESVSNLKDTWLFGAGPFSRGTIRKNAQLAGDDLPKFDIPFVHPYKLKTDPNAAPVVPVPQEIPPPVELPNPTPVPPEPDKPHG